MKARVRATGNIVDVEWYGNFSTGTIYADARHTTKYYECELDFDTVYDYWTRLEHQAAIAAMQGILSNPAFPEHSQEGYYKKNVVDNAYEYAHVLVEKMKEEKK